MRAWLPQNSTLMKHHALLTDTAFPEMSNDYASNTSVENWLGQPVLPWNYPYGSPKAVAGLVTTEIYFDETSCVG